MILAFMNLHVAPGHNASHQVLAQSEMVQDMSIEEYPDFRWEPDLQKTMDFLLNPFFYFEMSLEKTCLREFANNTGADQPAYPRSLISAFVIRFSESII